jgi:outer membrane protein assembly factor BamB
MNTDRPHRATHRPGPTCFNRRPLGLARNGLAAWMALQIAIAGVCHADNWPGWRGPTGVGLTDETDLPLTWNAKTGENVLWKVSLKGTTGHSSPIVWGDRVFITTAAKQTRQQEEAKEVPEHHLACYRVTDGQLLWRTLIPPGKEVAGYAIYASPTPVTDGKAVYVWFGSAVVAAVDFDGKLLWRHERPGPFNLNPGICSSPILYQDTVILICDQNRGQGFLQGLDKATGQVKWEQLRPTMGACNATPILLDVNGKTQLIVAGTNTLQGLDPANGQPIWWCKSWGFGASPTYGGGLIYADKGGNEQAIAVDPTGQGDVTATHVKWKIDKLPGDYASPVIVGDYVYRVQTEGIVTCLKLSTGQKVFTERLMGVSKLASPIATADGRVYFVSTGTSYVIQAGPTLQVLATNRLEGGNNGSSAAVSQGRVFVRDFESLYCIGKK